MLSPALAAKKAGRDRGVASGEKCLRRGAIGLRAQGLRAEHTSNSDAYPESHCAAVPRSGMTCAVAALVPAAAARCEHCARSRTLGARQSYNERWISKT